MSFLFIFCLPVLLAACAFLVKRLKVFAVLNAVGYFFVLCASVILLHARVVSVHPVSFLSLFYLDALSAFFILVTSVIAFAAALYSIGYIEADLAKGFISAHKGRMYYVLFNLFCFSMLCAPALNNLGILWVVIEMTTLISAFLVGFYNTKQSVEAAWKYIIICSVGIIFALLGTILFSYAFSLTNSAKSLNWSDMILAASHLDKNIVKLAFVFILVGYGTKAGLAPMHTWLPDAHSQAVAPISALLSGVLLKTALYAILRFGMIVVRGPGFSYFGNLMILAGLVSLAVSSGFILVQKDLKRLLAYSSIEHIGIVAIGLGVGTPLGILGALLHVFNHAVAKSFMFFGAGNIVHVYHKHKMKAIRGVVATMPFTGFMVLLGLFALTGMPPFSVFFSEIFILMAAFAKNAYWVAALFLLFIVIIFGAFIYHFAEMLFGNRPKDMKVAQESLSSKLAFLFLFLPICSCGVFAWLEKEDLLCLVQKYFQG